LFSKEKDLRRRDLLKGLATMPALSVFGSAHDDDKTKKQARKGPAGILRIILNGPFALVLEEKQPDKITFFCPIDKQSLHRFYVNWQLKDNGKDPGRVYHFELPPDGLDVYPRKHAYVDRSFNDISFRTDLWRKQEYFVTIELPVPDSIGFVSPSEHVVFEVNRRGLMPLNNVLEYRMTDPDDVKLVSKNEKIGPQSVTKLSAEYANYCKKNGGKDRMAGEECTDLEHEFKSWDEGDVRTFVLGIGVDESLDRKAATAHAIAFYNQIIADSFPHVKGRNLVSIGDAGHGGNSSRGAMLMPTVWNPDQVSSLFRNVSAILDCTVIGPHGTITG
jgi:hypothetical protein